MESALVSESLLTSLPTFHLRILSWAMSAVVERAVDWTCATIGVMSAGATGRAGTEATGAFLGLLPSRRFPTWAVAGNASPATANMQISLLAFTVLRRKSGQRLDRSDGIEPGLVS